MSDWLSDVIGDDLIAVYEGLYLTEDAVLWLRKTPRTFGELRAEEIDWLRWMAANVSDKDVLQNLSEDPDTDVRMWVACNPMTPELTLGKLAEDPVVFVRRGVAQNKRADLAGSDPQIAGSGRKAAVAEQQLDRPDIGA
jgi:hypothetical protein